MQVQANTDPAVEGREAMAETVRGVGESSLHRADRSRSSRG